MNKKTAKALAEKYGMEIIRHPITHEAWGVTVESDDLIPELDAYADALLDNPPPRNSAVVERLLMAGTYTYRIVCPTRWFDLWGWR